MPSFAAIPDPSAAGQLALGVVLAAAGVFLLLPKPRLRSVAGGTAALVAAAVVLGLWAQRSFGEPGADAIQKGLFILFSTTAVTFAVVLVAQTNPARGAIAFAFVVLSVCGLFLLLAAPFLMAATVIIYAGAIVVTFLFVLMLSQAAGPSDENDRAREPLLGTLAGFGFAGLVLFGLYEASRPAADGSAAALPAPVVTPAERAALAAVAADLELVAAADFYADGRPRRERADRLTAAGRALDDVVGVPAGAGEGAARAGSLNGRLGATRTDPQAAAVRARADRVRDLGQTALRAAETAVLDPARGSPDDARAEVARLRDEVRLLAGSGELPARNVGNLGLLLYANHLLSVELAGTLLLVATVGAVAIAHRRTSGQ